MMSVSSARIWMRLLEVFLLVRLLLVSVSLTATNSLILF